MVAANLWRWIVQTDSGLLNQTLRSWGLGDWPSMARGPSEHQICCRRGLFMGPAFPFRVCC